MIAVYSIVGGVGKTSLVATLGRTLSSMGEKVLLTDTTSHGLLPFYFGANELVSGVVRTFTPPRGSTDAPVHMVSYDLDRQGSDVPSQSALFESLLTNSQQVNRVLLDLSGNCVWLFERLAGLKPTILVPVAADMNSIVSLHAVEKKFAAIHGADGEPLRPVYLLNQFDASLPLHLDLHEVLRQQLGDRLLPFVVRRSGGISEALAEGMTIVDYAPDSSVAQDFLGLANWIRASSAPAQAELRSLRWSER
jgi:cellulose synthase operon protein YhjQ